MVCGLFLPSALPTVSASDLKALVIYFAMSTSVHIAL